MQSFSTQIHDELRSLEERLSGALAFEHELRDDRAAFGDAHSTQGDAQRERARVARHLEWFLLERTSEALGAVPLERFFEGLDDNEGEALASVYAALRASLAGVFLVKVADERDGLLVEDMLGRGQYVLAEAELAGLVRAGDLVVGRLYPLAIEHEGARTSWAASPAAVHLSNPELVTALERDLAIMRDRTRGPLRMSQLDLEAMFFSAGIEVSEARESSAAPNVASLRERARKLLIDAGLADERVEGYLAALAEHDLPTTDLALGGDDPLGWILDELAFASDVELDFARRVLADYWRALGAARAEGDDPGAASGDKVGEARAREALAKFDAGREAGRDLEDLFAELEADLGVEADEDEDPMGEFTGEFPGAIGALLQEFLWDAARLAQVELEVFAKQHRDLELLAQFGAFLVNADELSKRHVELFLGRWIWEEGRLQRGGYSALGAVRATRAFCAWMSEHQDLELAAETAQFLDAVEADAERIGQLTRAADPSGATARAQRGFFEFVGAERAETRWLDQAGGTFSGALVGLGDAGGLRSGDWVSAWFDDGQLGVIAVYPPVAGPYLKATS